MTKLIIFDLDGVLADIKYQHFRLLNKALKSANKKYVISYKDHIKYFDGLPTKEKLDKLTQDRGLPQELHDQIWKEKQKLTLEELNKTTPDKRICNVLKRLKKDGYKLMCASNAIRNTVKTILLKKGFLEYLDHYISNEDVNNNKPFPDCYYACMMAAGVGARQTLIVEDSQVGFEAVYLSGAKLCPVKSSKDVTYKKIKKYI